MILAGTGHRPDKLGGYDDATHARVCMFALRTLNRERPERVISGMALGWDLALAWACVHLKIPYSAYVPFNGHHLKWPKTKQVFYWNLLKDADRVVVCSLGGYDDWKMQKRNERMVDDCDRMLALWNGTDGGTANCLAYAEKVGRPIDNVWEEYKRAWDDEVAAAAMSSRSSPRT